MVLAGKIMTEAIGWTGAAASLSAFSLNSLNMIESQSITYLLLNILGCLFLITYAVFKKATASWVLNSIWLVITVVAFIKVYIVN
jgi:fluoride ion exporter CrcB/FEX